MIEDGRLAPKDYELIGWFTVTHGALEHLLWAIAALLKGPPGDPDWLSSPSATVRSVLSEVRRGVASTPLGTRKRLSDLDRIRARIDERDAMLHAAILHILGADRTLAPMRLRPRTGEQQPYRRRDLESELQAASAANESLIELHNEILAQRG